MAKPVYSVGQLAGYIAGILDAEELLRGICIDGEVSEMTTSGGNTYFTMKDAVAQLSCIYFGGRPDVAVGDRVVATGSPRYYVKGGKLSFIASLVEKKGEGDLYAQFALLKAKLEAAGVFSRKIQPPPEIRRIGIVTSPTGAVIRDIMNVAFRRNPNVNLVLYPAKVQGPGAAEAVAEAVHILDAAGRVDAIVVARGGGSMEDLAPFNTEVVARAVADCKTYIVSAVGHETDFSLCDFSADLRAPTPSAAAELLVRDVRADLRQITALAASLGRAVTAHRLQLARTVQDLAGRLGDAAADTLHGEDRRVRGLQFRLQMVNPFAAATARLEGLSVRLAAADPQKLLRPGFARVTRNGAAASASALHAGDGIALRFFDGAASAVVDGVTTNKDT